MEDLVTRNILFVCLACALALFGCVSDENDIVGSAGGTAGSDGMGGGEPDPLLDIDLDGYAPRMVIVAKVTRRSFPVRARSVTTTSIRIATARTSTAQMPTTMATVTHPLRATVMMTIQVDVQKSLRPVEMASTRIAMAKT